MGQSKEPNAYEQQLVSLGRVLQILREGTDVDVLVETVLTYLKSSFHYELVWVGFYDRLDHRLVGKGGKLPNSEESAFLKQRSSLSSGDLLEQVVIQQRPVTIADLRQEMRAGEWRKLAQKCAIQGTMMFPISLKSAALAWQSWDHGCGETSPALMRKLNCRSCWVVWRQS